MKKLLLLLLLSILFFSCEKDDGILVPTDEQNVEIRAQQDKVQICHKLGNGEFNLIEVNGNAVQAHINHGDGYPGECYDPEQNLYLTEVCEVVEDGCLSCGDHAFCNNIYSVNFDVEGAAVLICNVVGYKDYNLIYIHINLPNIGDYYYYAEYQNNWLYNVQSVYTGLPSFDDAIYDGVSITPEEKAQLDKMTEYMRSIVEGLGGECSI